MNSAATTQLSPAPRSKWDYYTTKEISAIIKEKLGYNSRQISVSKSSSLQYVTVTVRDATVNIDAVKSVCRHLHSWTMDNTDYCEGQSVRVYTTREVDALHAAPFLAAVMAVDLPENEGQGVEVVPGVYLWNDRHNCYVSDMNGNRGTYLYTSEVQRREKWAIQTLALHVSHIVAKQAA